MGKAVRAETPDVLKWRRKTDAGNGNRLCPGQNKTSDAYRAGWDRIFGKNKDK